MVTTGLVVAVIALLAATLALLACYEALKQVEDLRDYLDLHNDPIPLQLPHDPSRSLCDLLPSEAVRSADAMLLFLSNRCNSCLAIAQSLAERIPDNCWVVVERLSETVAPQISNLLERAERVLEDEDGVIAASLGLTTTPAVIRLSFGEVRSAYGVSSMSHVELLAPKLIAA